MQVWMDKMESVEQQKVTRNNISDCYRVRLLIQSEYDSLPGSTEPHTWSNIYNEPVLEEDARTRPEK